MTSQASTIRAPASKTLGYLKMMNWRSRLTALLAVMLLSISCAGPACAASCDLRAFPLSQAAHQGWSDKDASAMPADCNGMQMGQSGQSHLGASLSSGDCCGHTPCLQEAKPSIPSSVQVFKQPATVLTSALSFDTVPLQRRSHPVFAKQSPPLKIPKSNAILRI